MNNQGALSFLLLLSGPKTRVFCHGSVRSNDCAQQVLKWSLSGVIKNSVFNTDTKFVHNYIFFLTFGIIFIASLCCVWWSKQNVGHTEWPNWSSKKIIRYIKQHYRSFSWNSFFSVAHCCNWFGRNSVGGGGGGGGGGHERQLRTCNPIATSCFSHLYWVT